MPTLEITINELTYQVELLDTPTAKQLWAALPMQGSANIWGDEIYFEIPMTAPLEPVAREEVERGTIAYWPTGRAFCIFFGPTPVSRGDEPRAYSPVNILGQITGDLSGLHSVQQGDRVQLQPVAE